MSTICDDLRAAILQAAMQGKLTKQLPEDGDAKELLEMMRARKEELIFSGVIRKQTEPKPIEEKEVVFSKPDNWEYIRLEDVGYFKSGKTPSNNQLASDGVIPYFKVSDMNTVGNEKYLAITKSYLNDNYTGSIFPKNTIVYPKNGGAVLTNKKRILYTDSLVDLNTGGFCLYGLIDVDFFYLLFSTIDFRQHVKGTALPTIDMTSVREIILALPPLAEQKRIVEKVDELMARVADLEQSADALASLKKAFPDDIKASLLQAAMQGKLTKQLSEDGSAEDLLEEIKAEKEKLIAKGKIKKQKPLAPITDDEIPFSIPKNWKWVRLGNLTEPCEYPYADGPFGSNLKKEHYTTRREVRIIQLSNIGDGGWKDKNVKYTTYEHLKTIERSAAKCGDIVIAKMMPAGRAMIVPDVEESYVLSSDAVKIVPNRHVDTRYLEMFLNSPIFQRQVYSDVQGITRIRTSLSKLIGYLVAVPPIAEQRRIVERLDTFMQNINVVEDLIASE